MIKLLCKLLGHKIITVWHENGHQNSWCHRCRAVKNEQNQQWEHLLSHDYKGHEKNGPRLKT